jgi:PilZ domain
MVSRRLAHWGRWLGLGSSQTPEGDRRVWVRLPCSLETSLVRSDGADAESIGACVLDISKGGARLLVSRRFEPGDLLSIKLPDRDGGRATVLACVVRVTSGSDDQWTVGCSFADPLTDDDLDGFQGIPSADISEQRARPRFATHARARYHSIRGDASLLYPAEILNLSALGIALKLDGTLQIGELINLELCEGEQVVLTTLASVVRIDKEAEGKRVVGCTFIAELSEEHLAALNQEKKN